MPQTFAFFSFWYRNKMIRAQYGGNIFYSNTSKPSFLSCGESEYMQTEYKSKGQKPKL